MSSAKQFIKICLTLVAALCLISGVIALQAILEQAITLSDVQSVLLGTILIFSAMGLGGWMIYRAASPPLYRQVRKDGLPATARVLEAERTHWRLTRSGPWGSGSDRIVGREYRLQVVVTPPEGVEYEATVWSYFPAGKPPKKQSTIAVKIHPLHPEIVIMAQESAGA